MVCFHKRPLARFTSLSLGSLALLPLPSFADTPAGRVMFVHGDASIERDGERIPAERGADFFAGDTFHTAQASTLQLRYSDGGTKAIRPGSSYTLERYELDEDSPEDSEQSGELLRGGLRAITGAIGRNAPENVSHSTPVATMGIRGT
ncbi:MAG: FecR family protein, partial [Pseudomonadota bacterium]